MDSIKHIETNCCHRRELQDYIDGTLGSQKERELSSHIEACDCCRHELNLQKQFINGIDSILRVEPAVPHDFSRVVTAKAKNQVSGLRTRNERTATFLILIGFALVAFFVTVSNVPFVSAAFEPLITGSISIGSSFLNLALSVAFGLGVIARTIASGAGAGKSFLLPTIVLASVLASFLVCRPYFRRSANQEREVVKS